MLERLQHPDDFAFVFEHQDDILVFDSAHAPQGVDAFQVKTSAKKRPTARFLLTRKKLKDKPGHALSILGKLYRTRIKYQSISTRLAVVSNLPFNIKLRDDSTDPERLEEITFAQLAQSEQRTISLQLKEEHFLPDEPTLEGCVAFIRSRLTLTSHRNDAIAKLVDVVEHRYPTRNFRPTPLYATLMEEIRRKSEDETDYLVASELIRNKGFARAEVEARLHHALLAQDVRFDTVRHTLATEGMPATKVQRLASAWSRYELDRTDRTNTLRETLRRRIQEVLTTFRDSDVSLTELIKVVGTEVVRGENVPVEIGNDYLAAMILREFYETGSLPSPDTEPAKEDA